MNKMNQDQTLTKNHLSDLHHLDHNLYVLFCALYQFKNLSKVAQQLCMSQSAASHALQRLREQLNDDLFIRKGNQMHASPYAHDIYPTIEQILALYQQIYDAHPSQEMQLTELKIAMHDEVERLFLPKIVEHFQCITPNIQISSFKLNRSTILYDLQTQQVDFVIDIEQTSHPQLYFYPLLNDAFKVLSHTPLDQQSYLSAKHVGVTSRRHGLLLEDLILQKYHVHRTLQIRCQHYSTGIKLLQQHPDLVLTIPKVVLDAFDVQNMMTESQLVISDFPFEHENVQLGMYFLRDFLSYKKFDFVLNELKLIFA